MVHGRKQYHLERLHLDRCRFRKGQDGVFRCRLEEQDHVSEPHFRLLGPVRVRIYLLNASATPHTLRLTLFSCCRSDSLATGVLTLDLDCRNNPTTDGTSYCAPKTTSTGARPSLSFNTTLGPTPLAPSATCIDNKKRYQSWRLEKWLRQYQMAPASEAPGSTSTPPSDTGPSFTLTSMVNNEVFKCTTLGKQSSAFTGLCESPASESTQISFEFDPELNILTVSQYFNCGTGSSFEAVGIAYMQAACNRDYNSQLFTCTSDPVWVGTATV